MNFSSVLFWGFVAMVSLQLLLPLKTVYQHEQALRDGELFKFETRPVDPNDPFRGKYVALGFPALENEIPAGKLNEIAQTAYAGQRVYFSVEKDQNGYAAAKAISLDPPTDDSAYFPATVNYVVYINEDSSSLNLSYPFDRFYMEESKAPIAEERYRDALRTDSVPTYALVRIRNGIAVLQDVMIDGTSLKE